MLRKWPVIINLKCRAADYQICKLNKQESDQMYNLQDYYSNQDTTADIIFQALHHPQVYCLVQTAIVTFHMCSTFLIFLWEVVENIIIIIVNMSLYI